MENRQSKIHPKFQAGLILISGLHGLGKSTMAMTAERPSQSAVIDFDVKGEQMAKDYGIAFYASPVVKGNDPANFDVASLADWFIKQIIAIPKGTTTLIIDNATWAEDGLGYIVAQNPTKYGVRKKNAQRGIYGGVNPGITKLWVNIVTYLQSEKGVKSIFAINHMSTPWVNHAPVLNKWNVRGNKIFRRICIAAFTMVPSDLQRGGDPPIPSALVTKEAIAIRRFDEELDDFVTQRALPMRIPVADWAHIYHYFDEPADFENPAPGETWSQFELNAYGDWLSGEQVEWAKTVQNYEEQEVGNADTLTALDQIITTATSPLAMPAMAATIPDENDPALVNIVKLIREHRLDKSDDEIKTILTAEGHILPTVLKAFKAIGGMKPT